ncbi:MAG TPA: hypothetical protein VGQ90_16090, partial [Stellaceae bacterium]|nr:hypothetical protein [Stellaceae bacterium]
MSIAATATFAYLESAPGVFQYTVTLNNTGDTTIGTFWFAWDDAPDQDFMSAQPTNIGDPSGWTDTVTTHLYGSGTGYGIEWRSLSGSDLLAPRGSLDFTFTSTETPAEMAGP